MQTDEFLTPVSASAVEEHFIGITVAHCLHVASNKGTVHSLAG